MTDAALERLSPRFDRLYSGDWVPVDSARAVLARRSAHLRAPRYVLAALSSAEFQSGIDLTDVTRGKESRAARTRRVGRYLNVELPVAPRRERARAAP